MIPIKTVEELITKHSNLEKELSTGDLDKKLFAEKSKEYSDINEIIEIAKKYISFENDKKDEGIRLQVKDELKRQFTALDLLEIEIELNKLQEVFNTIKKEINETENQLHKNDFKSIEERIETVKTSEDFIQIFDLREECDLLLQKIIADKLGDKRFRASIIWYHQNFDSLEWKEDRKNEAKKCLRYSSC